MNEAKIKARIVKILDGLSEPIKADEIHRLLTTKYKQDIDKGRTQESIRKLVRELVNDQSNLIGSSNQGYFKIQTIEQLEKAIHYVGNRIPALQERVDNLKKAWNCQNPGNKI